MLNILKVISCFKNMLDNIFGVIRRCGIFRGPKAIDLYPITPTAYTYVLVLTNVFKISILHFKMHFECFNFLRFTLFLMYLPVTKDGFYAKHLFLLNWSFTRSLNTNHIKKPDSNQRFYLFVILVIIRFSQKLLLSLSHAIWIFDFLINLFFKLRHYMELYPVSRRSIATSS